MEFRLSAILYMWPMEVMDWRFSGFERRTVWPDGNQRISRNSPAMERLHCVAADGSLCFSSDPFTAREEIFVSRWLDGQFAEPEKLGKSYNVSNNEAAILIVPDEAFMLISHSDIQHTRVKFSTSFKETDGSWSDRIELPFYCGGFFALSPEGKYLFFLNDGIWWVGLQAINKL